MSLYFRLYAPNCDTLDSLVSVGHSTLAQRFSAARSLARWSLTLHVALDVGRCPVARRASTFLPPSTFELRGSCPCALPELLHVVTRTLYEHTRRWVSMQIAVAYIVPCVWDRTWVTLRSTSTAATYQLRAHSNTTPRPTCQGAETKKRRCASARNKERHAWCPCAPSLGLPSTTIAPSESTLSGHCVLLTTQISHWSLGTLSDSGSFHCAQPLVPSCVLNPDACTRGTCG